MDFIQKKFVSILLILFGMNLILFLILVITKAYSPYLGLIHIATVVCLLTCVLLKILRFYKPTPKDFLILLVLILGAFALRLIQLTSLPPGMYGDEISIGIWGLKMLESKEIPPFLHGYSHPTPLLYLAGISIAIFGKTEFAIRLPSVIFGSLSVVLFFILLKMFLKQSVSLLGALLLLVSYPHMVISRLAYEPAASFFCQILACIFLYISYKTKHYIYVAGLGVSLAFGFYTYLNFRIFGVFIFIIACILLKSKKSILILFASFFIGMMPLVSFALNFPNDFFGRTSEVFIFNLKLPPDEVIKELSASALRSFAIFGFLGDPSAKHNPSGVPFFELLTVTLIVIGIFAMAKKNKGLLLIVLLLSLPSFLGDILSLERIPEFHYYGIGHPHGLRISAMAGYGLFLATYGINFVKSKGETKDKNATYYLLGILLIIIYSLQIYWYFGQASISPNGYLFNYKVNGQANINAKEIVNKNNVRVTHVTPDYFNSSQLNFLIDNDKKIKLTNPTTTEDVYNIATKSEMTIIGLTQDNFNLVDETIKRIRSESPGINIQILTHPMGFMEAAIFKKGGGRITMPSYMNQ